MRYRGVLYALLAVFCARLAPSLADSREPPEALRRANAARSISALQTARIEYSVTQRDPDAVIQPHIQLYTYQSAGDHYVTTHRGDEEGVFGRGPDGEPVPPGINRTRRYLVKDEQAWHHIDGAMNAHVFTRELGTRAFRCLDLRDAGLNPLTLGTSLEERLRLADAEPLTYTNEVANGVNVVTGSTGTSMLKWWIDPERGWNVVRTEVYQDGERIGETRYSLKQNPYDGVWFPSRIEKYRLAAGDTEPSTVIKIALAEFNRPNHPLELTPADIGVEVGTMVTFQDREPSISGYWDGAKTVSFDELQERIDSGEIAEGPTRAREGQRWLTLQARNSGLKPGQVMEASPTSRPVSQSVVTTLVFESEWEAYTRRFIDSYGLNEDQAQMAWNICDDCQGAARTYVASRKTKLDELDQKIKAARDGGEANPETLQRLDAQRCELLAPVDRIFETRLMPRLDRLPTRAQRQAAATSQPAKKTPEP